MSIALLRVVLLVRCVICLIFAWALRRANLPTLDAFVDWFMPFAVVDGVLALALAPLVLAVSWGSALAALALIDGLLSIGWAVVLHRWPGIPGFPVSAVLLSGLLSVLSGVVGLFQLLLAVQLRRRSRSTLTGLALAAMGAAFILLAVIDLHLPVSPDRERKLAIVQALLQALAFGTIALASHRGRAWVEVRT